MLPPFALGCPFVRRVTGTGFRVRCGLHCTLEVLNTQKNFKQYISETAPEYKNLTDIDKLELKTLLEVHIEKTKSETAINILKKYDNWDNMFSVFGGIAEVDNNVINKKPENVKALD